MATKDSQLIFKCFECRISYENDCNKDLTKRFANIYKFCDKDTNKTILLLREGVYPYEYMNSWKRFNEISLPKRELFYSSLNLENITEVDYSMQKKNRKNL